MASMSNTPKKRGRKPVNTTAADRHRGWQLPTRVGEPLRKVLETLAREQRRSVAQMSMILLEEALAARGLWPPAEKGGGR
jgi:hypothetical protein